LLTTNLIMTLKNILKN